VYHTWNFSELFEKAYNVNSKNGVVGKTGNMTPIMPNTKLINAMMI
jgi:butyrate kinase